MSESNPDFSHVLSVFFLTLPVSGYGNPDNYSNYWIDVLYGFSNSKDSSEAAALHW